MRPVLRTELSIDCEIAGTYTPGTPDRQFADGTWEPGDAAVIENMRVLLVGSKGQTVDITSALSEEQLRAIEADAVEQCADGAVP